MLVEPVLALIVDEDGRYNYEMLGGEKSPPAAELLKQAAQLAKGSGVPNREKVGTVTSAQVEEICKQKMADLNARDVEHAARMIEGTARSMGIEVVD